MPDGRVAVSIRKGEVWIIDDALSDAPKGKVCHVFVEVSRGPYASMREMDIPLERLP